MGQAKRRKEAGTYPHCTFTPGVVQVGKTLRYVDGAGRTYTVRVGERITDPIESELIREKARELGMEIATNRAPSTETEPVPA